MRSRKFGIHILLRAFLMFMVLSLAAYALVSSNYLLSVLLLPVLIFQFIDYYRFHKKAHSEIEQFVESVHYRDFSRYFDVKRAPAELQPFRSGFNQINSTFKIISKEKETQQLHLKTILEIVDTGILSYEYNSGNILWMNESLKSMLQIPYLKTIHSLEKRNAALYNDIISLEPGRKKVTGIKRDETPLNILLSCTAFTSEDQRYKLIAFQNIHEALDESESKAWQKLLSVMTHEIMNSVAPISSLAETIKTNLHDSMKKQDMSVELLSDVETGISTIQKRSEGLLRFTEVYRNLSKITKADVREIRVLELFDHIQQLMQPTLDKKNIELDILLREPFLTLEADAGLLEQVLINLLINASEAIKSAEDGRITLTAENSTLGRPIIKVADNGTGIKEDILDKIFVPFFSTKKSGSGIGLSLCKQIMLLHNGNIKVQSKENEGTVFTLYF